jgi:hypothetical protein
MKNQRTIFITALRNVKNAKSLVDDVQQHINTVDTNAPDYNFLSYWVSNQARYCLSMYEVDAFTALFNQGHINPKTHQIYTLLVPEELKVSY